MRAFAATVGLALLVSPLGPIPGFAQPRPADVVARFKKNGVTAVDVKNTTKEWDARNSKWYWKVSLVKSQPVPPAEVDGLGGVTLLTHVVADYDLGGAAPYWSGVTFSEYKGINLPTPTKEELTTLLNGASAANPNLFFRSPAGKIGLDRAWTDDPQCEWVNPKKLNFKGTMIFRQEVSDSEIGEIQAPIGVTLVRPTLKGAWTVDFVNQYVEQQTELRRMKKGEAGSAAATMADAPTDRKNRAEIERLKVPVPPKYATPEALAEDLVTMIHNLDRERFGWYLTMMLDPDLRCSGCLYTANASGATRVDAALESAYDGAGTFRDQYCLAPNKLAVENGAVFFKNKAGDGESQIVFAKVGDFYCVNGLTLRVTKDAGRNGALKSLPCPDAPTRAGGAGAAAGSTDDGFKPGDHVLVEENGKWYPSEVLKVDGQKFYIHYDGYAKKYDLWVGPERIRRKS